MSAKLRGGEWMRTGRDLCDHGRRKHDLSRQLAE
jgi:hypothetical protein